MGMDELTLTYNAEKMELTIYPIESSRLRNITEVVRCEDCVHCIVRYSENEAYCGHPDGLNDCLRPDDFCSYGERREGE
jgi:hypothetical protein